MPFSAKKLLSLYGQSDDIRRLWIAYSGGMDSHVLLHRTHALRSELPGIAGAIHIHHGLSRHADDWQSHCRGICADSGIHFVSMKVSLHEGEGPEDKARRARYTAFVEILQQGDAILTAQHADDQAETLLLQAIRGGGPRGMAAMPAISSLGRGYLLRPLLEISRQRIIEYARQHALQWMEDESNEDMRFDRNFLRNQVIPLIRQRWPAASRTLARTASHTAALVALSDELLKDELQHNQGKHAGTLSIVALLKLPLSRASLLIRALCQKQRIAPPATVHITELLEKQLHAHRERQIHICWPGGEFRRYRDDLHVIRPLPNIKPSGWQYDWSGSGTCEIPELGGTLKLAKTAGRGLQPDLVNQGIRIRPRRGGEVCRCRGDRYNRGLKAIYQYHGIPPWERERTPLLFIDDKLVAVADIAICNEAGVDASETGFSVVWQRDATDNRA